MKIIFTLLLLSLTSGVATAGSLQPAYLTPYGAEIVAGINELNLVPATTAVGRMDYFITKQYLSPYSITQERNQNLKQYMTLASRLAMTGNIVAAQMVVNEIRVTPQALPKTALPILKRIINESTIVVDEDPLFVQTQDSIDSAKVKFEKWPVKVKTCAHILVMSAAYDDNIAGKYADRCLSNTQFYSSAILEGNKIRAKMKSLRKSVKS